MKFRTVLAAILIAAFAGFGVPQIVKAARTLIVSSSLNSSETFNNWDAVNTVLGTLINTGTAVSATAVEINNAADISSAFETVAATNTLTSAECGKRMILSATTEFASTLPSPTAGCVFMFIVGLAPSGASYTVVTASGANVMIGGVNELEVDTNDDGPYTTTGDTASFVDSVSVAGDWLECVSDGTSWYCRGQTNADGGIAFSQT